MKKETAIWTIILFVTAGIFVFLTEKPVKD